MHNNHGVCLGYLWYKRSVLGRQSSDANRNIKRLVKMPIRIIQSNVLSVDSKRSTLLSVSAVHQTFYISICIIKYCDQFKFLPWNIVVSLIYNVMLLMGNSFLYCDNCKKSTSFSSPTGCNVTERTLVERVLVDK